MDLLKFLLLIIFFNHASLDVKATESPWSFVVISDIHIYPSGRIPEKFTQMVNHVKNLNPDIVFITGDHTNGNRGDSHSEERIQYWYDRLDLALTPLYKAGIMVVPTVGNHDFYELKHQRAYKKWATKTLKKNVGTLNYDSENPLYFKFKYKNQEFFILKLWTQNIDSKQAEWLMKNSVNPPLYNRFAFGHVPIKSVKAQQILVSTIKWERCLQREILIFTLPDTSIFTGMNFTLSIMEVRTFGKLPWEQQAVPIIIPYVVRSESFTV